MDILKSYVTSITVCVFVVTLIENLLPTSQTKAAVKTVLAIITSAVIISPVLNIFNPKTNIFESFNEYTLQESDFNDIILSQDKQTQSLVCSQLEKQVGEILKKHGLNETAEVELSENYTIERVITDEISEKAKEEISSFLNISAQLIELR